MILPLDIPDGLAPQFRRPDQNLSRALLEDAAMEVDPSE